MAEELQFSSRSDNKRKLDDSSVSRRSTGFSPKIAPPSPAAEQTPPPSYNSVAPPLDGIQIAKQRAQEIAARLFNDAESKRPKVENGSDNSGDKGFSAHSTDYFQKPVGQQMPSLAGIVPPPSYQQYAYSGSSKKIEIPNTRVGVIIGKGGEMIRQLQANSGAKIQITKDTDADQYSETRTVDLVGTSEQINRADQLIKDVLAEAEAGGSARSIGGVHVGGTQFTMKVPNDRVGMIIGKGGETIKNMQANSGARIQIIPLHLPPGDTSTERTVHIDGTEEQIESAKQLLNEVMSAVRVRPQMSQQGYRPPRPPTNWGPPGQQPPVQQPAYGYMQPGSYPVPPPQYNTPQPYASYPQTPAPGWDQSSNPPAQQTAPASGYDYYNQQQQQPPSYGSQVSYTDAAYPQPATGQQQQQSYGQDYYSSSYQVPPTQPGYSQPASNPQDGSAAPYGTQVAPSQAPPSTQLTSSSAPPSYPSPYPTQGTASSGYGVPPSSQPAYAAPTGYQQSAPPAQPVGYGQPPVSQPGYIQYSAPPVQDSTQQQAPPSGYGASPQLGYGQQQQQQ